jgi:ketosteroid isomerase-like protein
MRRENVEVVRSAWQAWLSGDISESLAHADDDVVVTRVAPMPDATPYHGHEGMLQILADWVEGFEDFQMRPQEFIDANDRQVVMRLHQWAVGAQSGVPIEADFWFVHTMRAGKIARMGIYGSESQALKAVGLSE